MKKITIALFLAMFVLLGCHHETTIDDSMESEAMVEEIPSFTGFLGPWTRTATYVDGVLQGTTPASLNFYPDLTYDSATDVCATSGTYEEISDGTVTMVMLVNGCPGNISLPFTITYTYSIEENEDGEEVMTMITGPVMETYVR
ncbi:hypothetical protein KKA95_00835 [Patescibacteria group bacterium]|nr:hypothetical protein [Patescibacteria group bacterium]